MSAGRRGRRRVGQQRLEQRRLADAVPADQHDLLAAVDDRAKSATTCRSPSALLTSVHSSQSARRPVHREA
jgi:hypothetical protein